MFSEPVESAQVADALGRAGSSVLGREVAADRAIGQADRVGRIADHAQLDNLESGTVVGPWRLLDELGAGGMGTVFRAELADGA